MLHGRASFAYERSCSGVFLSCKEDVVENSGKDVEKAADWGSGFDKIKMECDQALAPYPVINANPRGGVELVCNACELYLKLLKYGRYYDTYPKDQADTQMSTELLEENKSVDRMMDILSIKLSEKEKAKMLPIAEYLKTHDIIDTQMVKTLTGKSRATASRYIQRLVELDILEKKGESVTTLFSRK